LEEKPCAADAMYAPVCTRFLTYDIALEPLSPRYCRTIMALAPMQAWIAAAELEPTSSKSWTWSFDLRLSPAARYSLRFIA